MAQKSGLTALASCPASGQQLTSHAQHWHFVGSSVRIRRCAAADVRTNTRADAPPPLPRAGLASCSGGYAAYLESDILRRKQCSEHLQEHQSWISRWALPSAACEWKAQLPVPPPEVLAKHTHLTKNFLLFTQLLAVQPDFSDQHRHSTVQPRGPSPASKLFLSGIPLPLEAGREGRHLCAPGWESRLQPPQRAAAWETSHKTQSQSPCLPVGCGLGCFQGLITFVFPFTYRNLHPMEDLDCCKYLNLTWWLLLWTYLNTVK